MYPLFLMCVLSQETGKGLLLHIVLCLMKFDLLYYDLTPGQHAYQETSNGFSTLLLQMFSASAKSQIFGCDLLVTSLMLKSSKITYKGTGDESTEIRPFVAYVILCFVLGQKTQSFSTILSLLTEL